MLKYIVHTHKKKSNKYCNNIIKTSICVYKHTKTYLPIIRTSKNQLFYGIGPFICILIILSIIIFFIIYC